MREILFRAKGQTSYKWYEGLLTRLDQDICHIKDNRHNEWICDSKTICQYTGLTDKNGRRIFEGDIISKTVNIYSLGGMESTGERMLVGTVIWDESSTIYPGGWGIKAKDEHGNDTVYAFDNGFEVIGNIFDNPELLN